MADRPAETPGSELEPVMVIMQFEASDIEQLLSILSKYVVVARTHPGSRNIDFVASATDSSRLVLVQKWDSVTAQRAHFDSSEMVDMARACEGLLASAPHIDLFEGVSMHDLA